MPYNVEAALAHQYYHSGYLPYQTEHATGLSSTQRPHSGPSSAPDPATFDFPSGTTKYDCPWCDKSYTGPNGRSIWRRHAQEKHNLPCNSRRSRWDADPDRPRNSEDKKDRNLACKRQWAKDNRIKKRLLKQLDTFSPSNLRRTKIEADLTQCTKRLRSKSVEKENLEPPLFQAPYSQRTPVFAQMDSNAAASDVYDYASDPSVSGWSTASQESTLLDGWDGFNSALSEAPSPDTVTRDDPVSMLVSYTTAAAAEARRSPPSPVHSVAPRDDEVYSEEEAEEMMQFVEQYSIADSDSDGDPPPPGAVEQFPPPSNFEHANGASYSLSLDAPGDSSNVSEMSGLIHDNYSCTHVTAVAPFSLAIRRAIWKREQEEAEEESKIEESLFTPANDSESDDYAFGDRTYEQEGQFSPLHPVSSTSFQVNSDRRSISGPAATPGLGKCSKMTESPFHIKPVETTPDKRRLAWELGLGADSSPGSGFYLAQVKSAVAGRWVDEF
ncbi:hypothetical protein DACRYDRAFT_117508 [Dacryopinax primogenitus]|uniref:Uncharacterized protein n=1 Tax=Dacryopinax primogenitus (strain DJM 731) TaxID=1858805 RepID=M5G1V7_DACPD|nr:uncharacterized protein DACRYDRAFT_117508 [Dacryopinax primogenitus]EJT99881.1 hypothetical protein DACRYDRAFT_117508 [Dacryopinax primogenitus]